MSRASVPRPLADRACLQTRRLSDSSTAAGKWTAMLPLYLSPSTRQQYRQLPPQLPRALGSNGTSSSSAVLVTRSRHFESTRSTPLLSSAPSARTWLAGTPAGPGGPGAEVVAVGIVRIGVGMRAAGTASRQVRAAVALPPGSMSFDGCAWLPALGGLVGHVG